jgi:hypothetical protein
MYAIVRDATYDSARLAQGTAQLDEFQAIHARQPGYAGSIVIDLGNGRRLSVNLWESEAQANAALPVMVPVVERLVAPLLKAPAQLLGAGPVVATDLTKA